MIYSKQIKNFYLLFLIVLMAFHLSCKNPNPPLENLKVNSNKNADSTQLFKIIAIKDGDTFSILKDGEEQAIRLAHIDCPEKNQPFGKQAKQLASDLCFGKMVSLKTDGKTDRNGRIIAEVLVDTLNVNQELVRQGMAWHFKKYSKDTVYADLEIEARLNHRGLWQGDHPIEPTQWRKGNRH